jgi:hypothetical protein
VHLHADGQGRGRGCNRGHVPPRNGARHTEDVPRKPDRQINS